MTYARVARIPVKSRGRLQVGAARTDHYLLKGRGALFLSFCSRVKIEATEAGVLEAEGHRVFLCVCTNHGENRCYNDRASVGFRPELALKALTLHGSSNIYRRFGDWRTGFPELPFVVRLQARTARPQRSPNNERSRSFAHGLLMGSQDGRVKA